jgi:hypothetical protein
MESLAQTLLFLAMSVGFALLLWHDRPSSKARRSNGLRLLRSLLILGLPVAAFLFSGFNNNSDRLTLQLRGLYVTDAAVADRPRSRAGDFEPYLVVADRPEGADLAVAPYRDDARSGISLPAELRRLVTVIARPAPNSPAGTSMDVVVDARSFPPIAGAEIPGMVVRIDQKAISRGGQRLALPADGRMRVEILRDDGDGRLAARRSFVLTHMRGKPARIELALDQPIAADAGSCEAPRLRLAPASSVPGETKYREPDNLVFDAIGSGGQHPVLDPRWLGPIANRKAICRASETRFAWPSAGGLDSLRLSLTSKRTFLPLFSVIFLAIIGLATHWLCASHWSIPDAERIVVPLLQWLLALRLLIGVEGLYNDSGLLLRTVLFEPLTAFLCLPILAVTLLRPQQPETKSLMICFAVLLIAGFYALNLQLGRVATLSVSTGLIATTFLAVTARYFWGVPNGVLATLRVGLGAVVRRYGPALSARMPGPRPLRSSPLLTAGLAIIVLLILFRLGFLAVGYGPGKRFSERAFGVPLSLFYIPGILLGFALMLDALRDLADRTWAPWLVLGAFASAYILVPLLTRDNGLIFVSGWSLAALIFWFAMMRNGAVGHNFALWILPVLTPVLLVILFALWLAVKGPVPAPADNLGRYLAEAIQWDRNSVRMLAYLQPAQVPEIGTKIAMESLDQTTSLGPLTSSLVGHGYLTPSYIRTALRAYQYSDNLSAVHIIWPWGRVGALSALAVILAGAAALQPERRRRPAGTAEDRDDWVLIAALGASLTFFWTGAYMVLANLNWVPFTGRNIYLLAVTSGGDLAEGFVLLLMAALPYAGRSGADGVR